MCFQALASFALFDSLQLTNLYYAIAVGFGAKWIYSALRIGDSILAKEKGLQFLKSEFVFIVLSLVFWLASYPSVIEWIGLLASMFLCVLYGLHIFGPKATRISLRQPGWLKLFTIAIVWLSITVIIPMVRVSIPLQANQWHFILLQLLWLCCLIIPFDFLDHKQQKSLGFPTIASDYGVEKTKQIGRSIALLTWIVAGLYSVPMLFTMSILILIYLFLLHSKKIESWTFQTYSLSFDGLLILQALLILMCSFANWN